MNITINRSKTGRFPGKQLEKNRHTVGYIKLRQFREDIPDSKNLGRNKSVKKYELTFHPVGEQAIEIAQTFDFAEAKQIARDAAVQLQCAFYIPTDYTQLTTAQ